MTRTLTLTTTGDPSAAKLRRRGRGGAAIGGGPIPERTPVPTPILGLHGHGDDAGHVFASGGELYRAIRPEFEGFYRRLLASDAFAALGRAGRFVGTEIAKSAAPGGGLVLRHERLRTVVYPTEWCWSMLHDAATATLDAELALAAAGATVEDAHPWNVLFHQGRAVLVDFTAFKAAGPAGGWAGERCFREEFVRPLRLMRAGRPDLARLVLDAPASFGWELWRLWPSVAEERLARLAAKLRPPRRDDPAAPARRWRRRLATLAPPDQPEIDAGDPTLARCLLRHGARSALVVDPADDLPVALARGGLSVVATVARDALAERLYQSARLGRLDLVPVVLDALAESSPFGLFERPAVGPAAGRLGCDAAVVPQLRCGGRGEDLWAEVEQRVAAAATYGRRNLAVEVTAWTTALGADVAAPDELWRVLARHLSGAEWLAAGGRRWCVGGLAGRAA